MMTRRDNARRDRAARAVASKTMLGTRAMWVGFAVLALAILAALPGCNDDTSGKNTTPARHAAGAADEAGHAHEQGPHGGVVVDVGAGAGCVEFGHDLARQRIDLWVLADDDKTPRPLAEPPAINLRTPTGSKRLTLEPVDAGDDGHASHFAVVNPLLASEGLQGQIVLTIHGKEYYTALPEHDHGDDHAHHHDGEGATNQAHDSADEHADSHGDEHADERNP
jgi:hypothetical protein